MIDHTRRTVIRGAPSLLACVTVLWLSALTGVVGAADSPQSWLERMADAGGKYSFRGTLVHMCGEKVDVVHIVRRVEGGQVTERITALDTAGREIIRNPEEVMCILPDQKTVMVDRRNAGITRPADQITHMPSFASVNPAIYRLKILPSERIAGRDTQVIAVRPTDRYRYGYRLWLDATRALPLKYALMSESGRTLEQTLFTEIMFDEEVRRSDVEPTVAVDNFVWQRAEPTPPQAAGSIESGVWESDALPVGFELTMARSQLAGDSQSTMEHLVYSDGLASVSVFIEGGVTDADLQTGTSQVGATVAYTTIVDGYLVTAIGSVPLGTARMIALSVRPVGARP
jgi:sigma-E factor negative regulatory protein RseB